MGFFKKVKRAVGKKLKQAVRVTKGVATVGLSETKGGRSFLAKAAAPTLGTAGFVLGGPAGAALGAALGTRLSQGKNANWGRVLRSGAIGFGAGGAAAGLAGMAGGTGTTMANLAKVGKGAMGVFKAAGGAAPGGQPGGGGSGLLGGLAGAYGAYQGYKGQEGALEDLSSLEQQQRQLISRQTELAGLDPVVAAQMKHQASQDLRAGQAERGIFESGVAAKQEAELMPQIDQQQRSWQLQQLAGISPQYQPLMESARYRAGMYGTGEEAGGALAGLGGGGGGSDLLAGLAGKAWDTGKDWLSGLWGGSGGGSSPLVGMDLSGGVFG